MFALSLHSLQPARVQAGGRREARRRAVVIKCPIPRQVSRGLYCFGNGTNVCFHVKGHDRGASFSFICHSAEGNLVILPKETDGPAVGNLLAATCEDHRQDDET